MVRFAKRLTRDRRGVSIVEFAIVLPVLLCLMIGMLGYGQYFLLAHSLQQIANDAARATVAGLNADERTTLADKSVKDDVAALGELGSYAVHSTTNETSDTVTVRVWMDASATPLFRTALVPMPDPVIERRAVVRPGGLS